MTTHMLLPTAWVENQTRTLNRDPLLKKEDIAKSFSIELKEDEKTKDQCLQQLREWAQKHSDIENCLMDDNFLLRFLRVKKYSLFMAQQTLLKYLNYRKRFHHLILTMDYKADKVYELITNGYIYASPFRDSKGRRVVLYNVQKFDINRFSNVDMGRVTAITYESVIDDEETQILGVNHVADLSGISPAFTTLFTISEFTTIIRWGEQSFPMRHKEINLLNVPATLKYVYEYALSNMTKKLNDRFTIHKSIEDLHKTVDKQCLPKELGGIMSSEEMLSLWRDELANKRDRLISFDKMNLISDKGIITRKNAPSQTSTSAYNDLPGSFRKLEVD